MSSTASSSCGGGTPPTALPGSCRRHWRITTRDGDTVAGPLPAWAGCDPSEDGVPPAELPVRLADITHHAAFPGQTVTVYSPSHASGQPCDVEILHGSIDCVPFAEQPASRVPVVNLRLTDECWITDLTPDDLAALSAQLRSQADRLDREIRPTLIAARSDWAEWVDHNPDAATTNTDTEPLTAAEVVQ